MWRGGASVPTETVTAAMAHSGWDKLQIQVDPPTLRKLDPALELDLSCIVEGHALQRIDQLLTVMGSQGHLIEISGEVLARGTAPDGEPWQVGIQTPAPQAPQGAVSTQLPLTDQCVATAGTYRQQHILDPRTGQPVSHALRSVSVVGEDPVLADAQCTALLVLGPEAGRKRAKELGINAVFLQVEPTP